MFLLEKEKRLALFIPNSNRFTGCYWSTNRDTLLVARSELPTTDTTPVPTSGLPRLGTGLQIVSRISELLRGSRQVVATAAVEAAVAGDPSAVPAGRVAVFVQVVLADKQAAPTTGVREICSF